MITIDKTKCIGCGQCVQVCPFTVLEMDDDHKVNCIDKQCIKCLHCAAICPVDAITYHNEKAVMEAVKKLPMECSDNLETLVKQRRSYRKFYDKKVERTEICKWIELAALAPSAKNQHPVHWIVVDNQSTIDKMMQVILDFCKKENTYSEILEEYNRGNNPVLGENASVMIGYCYKNAINPASDTAIAFTTIELLMQAKGIGTCWGGYLMRFINSIPECRALIGLPEEADVYGTLLFGYARQKEYRYVPARLHKTQVDFV